MKNIVLILLLFASISLFAKDKDVIYGCVTDASEVMKSDIASFIKKGYKKTDIDLIGSLYSFSLSHNEVLGKEDFSNMLAYYKKEKTISIEFLDDLGFNKETIEALKKRKDLVNGLKINVNGETSGEKLLRTTKEAKRTEKEVKRTEKEVKRTEKEVKKLYEERKRLGKIGFAAE